MRVCVHKGQTPKGKLQEFNFSIKTRDAVTIFLKIYYFDFVKQRIFHLEIKIFHKRKNQRDKRNSVHLWRARQ